MVSYKLRFETLPYTKAIVYGIFYLAEEIGAGGAVVCCGVLWIFWECQPAAEKKLARPILFHCRRDWRGRDGLLWRSVDIWNLPRTPYEPSGSAKGILWIFGICPEYLALIQTLPWTFGGHSRSVPGALQTPGKCQ